MSPLRQAYPGGTVEIVVHFAGKLGPQGTPEGNVTRVELWVNGVLVATIQNPPNVKSGTVTFHLDLSRYGEGTISLSAVAYQGNGKSAPSGASASVAVGVDLTDPTGTITIPTEGALVPSARPMARADYTDPPGAGGYASGIDRASVRLYDEHGTDVTGDAEVGDGLLLYTPAPERALADGPHELRLHVVDFAGRTFETTRHFTTDTILPGLTLETPADQASLFASDLAFSFSATDANGVALVSATVDGTDITERFARDGDRFTYTPHAGDTVVAELGLHTWHVIVADGAGNPTERSLSYTIVENPGGGGGTPTPPLYHIHILAGDGQTGAIGRCVDGPQIPGTPETAPGVPESVRVVDDNARGAIAVGVPLVFRGRGQSFEAPGFSTVTNSEGIAAVRYILGRTEGDDPITVEVLGDPTAIGVTFHETAVKPTLFTTLGMSTEPGFAGKTLLAKGGNGWVFATLTRPGDPGERPIGISASVRLDVSKVVDGVATPAAENEMYVNPRSRMTTKYGAATFILIPDVTDDADWQAKLSIPDFPELEPPPVSFRSSGTFSAGDVDHISELFATQGGITAVGHPVTLNADLTPMFTHIPPLAIALGLGFVVTHCELTVFGAAQDELGQTLYRFGNVDGGTGVATDGKWTDGHPDPHFALTVEPNASSVGSYPWIMTASMKVVLVHPLSGGVVTGLYHERLVVGAPEVSVVEDGSPGEFVGLERLRPGLFADPGTGELSETVTGNRFFLEERMPVGGQPEEPATLKTLDACREEAGPIPLAIAPKFVDLPLAKLSESDRFTLYRSEPLLATAASAPTSVTPSVLTHAPSGEKLIALLAGSGLRVGAAVTPVTPDWEMVPQVAFTASGGVFPTGGAPPPITNPRRQVTPNLTILPDTRPITLPLSRVEHPIVGGYPGPEFLDLDLADVAVGLNPGVIRITISASPPEGAYASYDVTDPSLARRVPPGVYGHSYAIVPPQRFIQVLLGEGLDQITRERNPQAFPVSTARQLTTDMAYGLVANAASQSLSPTVLALGWVVRNRILQQGHVDPFGSGGNFTYQGVINTQFNAVDTPRFTRALRFDDLIDTTEQHDERPNYLIAVESAGNVFANLSVDPTWRLNTPDSGILWFVSDTFTQAGVKYAGIDRSHVKAAIRDGLTGDADDEHQPARDLVVPGTNSTGNISSRQLQAIVFPNVPGFVFFRVIEPADSTLPMVVVLPAINGN